MPKAKIMGATCKALTETIITAATAVVVTANACLISAINISSPTTISSTAGSVVVSVTNTAGTVLAKLVTGASGEGFVSFPAPILANGVKVVSTANVAGKVVVYVID